MDMRDKCDKMLESVKESNLAFFKVTSLSNSQSFLSALPRLRCVFSQFGEGTEESAINSDSFGTVGTRGIPSLQLGCISLQT